MGDDMKNKTLIITIIIELALIIAAVLLYNPFLKIKLVGNATIKVSIGDTYEDKGATASYLKEDLTQDIKVTNNVDTSKLGEYQIIYEIKRKNTTKKVKRTVIVADLVSPLITLKGEAKVSTCGKEYTEEGYTATDNVDGDITEKVKVTKEANRIIYSVSDKSGNKKEVIRTLESKDTIKPEITLINSEILTFEQNSKYQEFGAKAVDNCDGDISSKIEVISNVNTSKHEVFTVTYKVTDNSGNEASVTRKIKIYNQNDLVKDYNSIIAGPTYIDNILIVNKKYSIPKTFKADNTKALEALEKLKAGAKEAGYNMPTVSGYRSYDTQASLCQNWISKRGVDGADRISARPGHSEHQTGLGFDVGQCCSTAYGTTPAGIWLKENAHKYGFIIRYPEFKEGITGYGYEPWHIRYLGVDIATEIYEKKITLEEYLGVYDINS